MAEPLTIAEEMDQIDPNKHREDLLSAFTAQQSTLNEDRAYYESERRPDAIGVATPVEMRKLLANVGYPRTYIDSLGDRLDLQGFRIGGEIEADEVLWDWWQRNDLDVESTLGHVDAFVHGRSYVTISAPDPADPTADPEIPIIRVEPPTTLYAEIDPRTRKVKRAIRAIASKPDNPDDIDIVTIYLPNQTIFQSKLTGDWAESAPAVVHGLGVVPVVPLANRSRLSDLSGTSEITPEIRSVTDAASRILMNLQSAAELMATPQRLLFGISEEDLVDSNGNPVTPLQAYLANILTIADENGSASQFSAAELRNYVDALDQLDRKAATYTGLPPQYLSSQSENPASADAIRASESRLVKKAERKARVFGGAWEEVMRVAVLVMNPSDSGVDPKYHRLEAIWADPATPTYTAKADAASKLFNQGNGVIPKERARIDMGYTVEERLQMKQFDEEDNQALIEAARLYGSAPAPGGPPSDTAPTDQPEEPPADAA